MRLGKVAKVLQGIILTPELNWQDVSIEKVCGADLMSDVLAFAEERTLLLTGLIYPQVIRTSDILDIRAIVFVNGKVPPKEVVRLAAEQNVPLLTTSLSMYDACGRLYQQGIGVGEEQPDEL